METHEVERQPEEGTQEAMARCTATAKDGRRCGSPPLKDGSGYCWMHSPATAKQRREAQRKGGLRTANKRRALVGMIDFSSAEGVRAFLEGLATLMATDNSFSSQRGRDVAAVAMEAYKLRHARDTDERLDTIEGAVERLVAAREAEATI